MSKFTKYAERALDNAKPEKEAGLVVALTSEQYAVAKVVGDPKVVGQFLAVAVEQEINGVTDAIKELVRQLDKKRIDEFFKLNNDELQNEQED